MEVEETEAETIIRYVNALCREIEGCKKILRERDFSAESIFIGGGTPSLLNKDQIGNILDTCRVVFGSKAEEITIEANPSTITLQSLEGYRESGINRLSLGCQSFDDEELKKIGRVYKGEDIYKSFELAKEAGFKNISIDLIFGIPGQDLESFRSSLGQALSLGPRHFSLYNLSIEESTHFQYLFKRGELVLPGEDEQVAMYECGIKTLSEKGYEHYEISNFARQGERCRHNVNYWRGGEYLGFGAGAHSFLRVEGSELRVKGSRTGVPPVSSPSPFLLPGGERSKEIGGQSNLLGRRWWNLKDVKKYCEAIEEGNRAVEDGEELYESKLLSEAMMLGLRMIEGIDTMEFYKRHSVSITERYENEIGSLMKEDLIFLKDGRLKLTHKGILFSNEVFLRFMA